MTTTRMVKTPAVGLLEQSWPGAALLAGRLRTTIVSHISGEHVSLTFKGWAPPGGSRVVPWDEATRIYVNVTNSWDKVATIKPADGVMWRESTADDCRWWTARKVLDICAGFSETCTSQYELEVGRHCLRCGAELDEPESIACGFGPVCRGHVSERYGTSHVVKAKASALPTPAPAEEQPAEATVQEPLFTIRPGESLDNLFERMMGQ